MRHKHAFLIMAHNNWYVLEKLILLIDAPFNDIYLHIDKKVKDFDFIRFSRLCKSSKVIFVKRINVTWGNESQIRAEIELFKSANNNGPYWYYHFLSGSDLILKPIDEIYDFFESTQENFLQVLPANQYIWRLKNYINIFRQSWLPTLIKKKLNALSEIIQYKLNTNRLTDLSKKYPIWGKGHNWCDLTQSAVDALIAARKDIKKFTRFTHCSDELYKQIILLNDKTLAKTISQFEIRKIEWEEDADHPRTFEISDYENLMLPGQYLFARKFDDVESKECVDLICNKLINGRE